VQLEGLEKKSEKQMKMVEEIGQKVMNIMIGRR
jgi:hypothetical protein